MIPNIARTILASEKNSVRFENFCIELFTRVEGIQFVPTSANYDQGRDARTLGKAKGAGPRELLCATTEKNQGLDVKVRDDSAAVANKSDPDRLVYCVAEMLTEHRLDQLEAIIRKNLKPTCSLTLYSGIQIASLVEGHHEEVFSKFYRSELHAIESRLRGLEHDYHGDDSGLRLAVLAFASEDARNLKESLARKLVMAVIRKLGGSATSDAIGSMLASDLGLSASFSSQFIEQTIEGLGRDKLVTRQRDVWNLTDEGEKVSAAITSKAAEGLLQGAEVVRERLQVLTGLKFTKTQFDAIWSALLDFLTELFHSNGLAVISVIRDFVSGTAAGTGTNFEQLIQRGAAKVAATASFSDVGLMLEQAVNDMLTEHGGPAFEWLAQACERFVALCALGLEGASSEQLRKLIARYKLVLDSDIVITYLCQGEPGHNAIREIVRQWQALGGGIVLAPSVLNEVAYHAHISDRDFKETKALLGKLSGEDLTRYCSNAFVRAFHAVESDPKHWPMFRDQYRGATPKDYSKILEILRDELVVELLPVDFDPKLAVAITEYLTRLAPAATRVELAYYGSDNKQARDGRLLASLASFREHERSLDPHSRVALLSSSSRLRLADARFRQNLGSPEAVISRGAVSYILSLVPGVTLGPLTLRQALFDFGDTSHLADSERLAMRIIKAADTVTMPWAKRPLLRKQLDENLRREAEKSGLPLKQVREDFKSASNERSTAVMIAKTIKDIALEDPERTRLQRQVRELEKRLEKATKHLKVE